MVTNINAAVTLCGSNIHVYSISTNASIANNRKTYYQHRHPGFEIHYICSGGCKVTCCGSTYSLEQTSMILIPPGAYHDVVPTEPNTVRICLTFSIQNNISTNSKTNAFYEAFDRKVPAVSSIHDSEPQHILNRIRQLVDSQDVDNYKNDKLLTLCSGLLLELIPYIADTDQRSQIDQGNEGQEDINFKIDSFLGTNFMCNNAKSRIASDLYISPRQLQRIIQKNYGMSYRQKLSETRVQIAVDLLCNSDTPIHKIAEILGYSCSANFSAFIKRTTGKTPSQIRKEQ